MATRFIRQEKIARIGARGQRVLGQATIGIVGVGGLGSVAAELVCRAGVRNLILIDDDSVSEINLPRQLLYSQQDIGARKVAAAKQRLEAIWPEVRVATHPVRLDEKNAKLLADADVILDGTDNVETRHALAAYAKKTKKPFIYAGAIETRGLVFPVLAGKGDPGLDAVLPRTDQASCSEVGVINLATVMTATVQVGIAIRLLLGETIEPLLHRIDAWQGTVECIRVNAGAEKKRRKHT